MIRKFINKIKWNIDYFYNCIKYALIKARLVRLIEQKLNIKSVHNRWAVHDIFVVLKDRRAQYMVSLPFDWADCLKTCNSFRLIYDETSSTSNLLCYDFVFITVGEDALENL